MLKGKIRLVFRSGARAKETLELDRAKVVIGSSPKADVVLAEAGVAPEHCAIERLGEDYRIIDLGSAEGTHHARIGGRDQFVRISGPALLHPGDSIWVGKSRIIVEFEAKDRTLLGLKIAPDNTIVEVRKAAKPSVDDAPTLLDIRGRGKSRATPEAPRRVDENPTQPWEGVTTESFVVERADTSNDPIEMPEAFRERPRLEFIAGPHVERRVYLGQDEITLGRAEDNIVVLHDPLAAPHLARVVFQGGAHRLIPIRFDAAQPLLLNGKPVTKLRILQPGDIIGVGASTIEMRIPSADANDETATEQTHRPRFCIRGDVLEQFQIVIGRDPAADLFLDDDEVERHHAKIAYTTEGFVLKDLGGGGTFVRGTRVVEQPIESGTVVHIAGWQLKCEIEGARLNLDVAEPIASIEIERFASDVGEGSTPYQALYRLALPAEADPVRTPGAAATNMSEASKAKKKKKKAWVPPRDVQRSYQVPILIVAAVIVGLTFVAAVAQSGGRAFLRRTISAPHMDAEFKAALNDKLHTDDACRGCHQAFKGAVSTQCLSCHEGHGLRPQHAVEGGSGAKRPAACTDCHTEHQPEMHAGLVAGARCAACHPNRHAKLLPVTPGPSIMAPPRRGQEEGVLIDIRADLGMTDETLVKEIHKKHASVERRCLACHAEINEKTKIQNSWSACFRCHSNPAHLSSMECADCHREHGKSWAPPVAQAKRFEAPPFLKIASVVLLLLLPLAFVLGFHAYARTRREEDVAEQKRLEEIAASKAAPAENKLVHNINLEKCVGCASCVNACPNDVLELEPKRHKSTVVRFDECKQCRACEQICPSGALTMAPAGAPPRMLELPDLDANFETNIQGVYLIGEAAGKSLVKNANNLGYRVVQHMLVTGIAPGTAKKLGYDLEVVAVGSGPGGLSTGISCFQSGLSHVILEKDRLFASTIQTYPKGKELLAEPPEVKNIGPLPVWDSYKEEILEKWNKELTKYTLDIRCSEEVRHISKLGNGKAGFKIITSKREYTCLKVVLATGTRGNPRQLKVPGGDSEKVNYILIDPDGHQDHDCLVVGGGDSAVEAAMALALSAEGSNRVSLSYRKASFERVKDRNKEQLMKLVEAKRIALHLETSPLEIRADSVILESKDGSTTVLANHVVYCMLGADPPVKWLKEVGVQYVKKPENWSPGATDDLSFLELQRKVS
jgi:thioredoxin reductase/pSer/pThr/pTyr-binding forkhead associated (FHA) protein/NAD-dependent dihydropyrimidine dehydrogenase PreA subunit